MTKLKFICLFFLLLLLGQQSQAQKRYQLKGILIDHSNGMPVNNATIYAIKSKQSTITDKDGKFSIQISAEDSLEIAHIAFNPKVVPVDNLHGNITLGLDEKNNELQEVTIHSGYQQLKPNQTTGSYVVIGNKQLNQQTGLNILDRLKGVTNGLLYNIGKQNNNPQNKTNITIRGYSTINGPLDPLIVVDNFIYDGDINNINPNDVESITLLKDAAAASIWGARAGNGVIVITTKKGHFNQKLQIAFNSSISIQQKPDLYYYPQISSSDYIDYEQFLFSKGYYNSSLSRYNHPAVSPAVLIFQQKKKGLISAADSAKEINALKQTDSRDDFTKYYYCKAITQQYALSLNGGSQNLAWLLSGNYDKSTSNLRAQYNKINLRFENTYKPLKNMTLNVGVYYTNSNSLNGLPGYGDLITLNGNQQVPYLSLAGINGAPIAVPHYYNTSYTDTVGAGKLLDWGYYPLEDYKHSTGKINLEELVAHVGLDYRLTKGLDFNLLYQYQKQNTQTSNLFDTAGYFARDEINKYSQIDRSTGVVNYIVPLGGIMNKAYSGLSSYNFRGQLNFNRVFNHLHRVNAIAGMEVRDNKASSNSAIYYGYNADPLIYASAIDYVTRYPIIYGGKSTIPAASGGLTETENRFLSFFANASYTYNDKYIASGSLRKDGSNIFGANTNDKWNPLWSAGLGWILSKEKFYRLKWLSFLKLSTTYGVSGNVDLNKSALPVAVATVGFNINLPSENITVLNNPDLRWEKAYQTNLRLDFATVKNTISGSLEYYHKKGTDLYAPTPYDYTAWGIGSTITANAADMKGSGVDVSLHSNNIDGAFKWSTNFIFN